MDDLLKAPCLVLFCCVFSLVCYGGGHGDASGLILKLLKAPRAISHMNSATFVFQLMLGENVTNCSSCTITCKLDDENSTDCKTMKIFYAQLEDGNHMFEACANVSEGVGCATYNWVVDTIPPTAYISSSTPFTNALNVSVDIFFTEPCIGEEGFRCSSTNSCNLLVYGAGHVIPSSLTILKPNLKYSLHVGLSPAVLYGRVVLVMDKDFCTDAAGNRFTRTTNSRFFVHFDRRNVYANLRTRIPEKSLQLNHEIRTVQATNDYNNLMVYLYFSKPVLNTSIQILHLLNVSDGAIIPIHGEDVRKRRFRFEVTNISSIAVVTISLDTSSIVSRQGTLVSPIAPVTFLFDSGRPAVSLTSTSRLRTQHTTPIAIEFMKPVFGFNASVISISGGHLCSFNEVSRSLYIVQVQHENDIVYATVPENVTMDIAGNNNLPSNVLQLTHFSEPIISFVVSTFATSTFLATSFAAGLLTLSTASLQSLGAFSRSTHPLATDPTRILFRTACHIQVFALSRWLAVTLPVNYYEVTRGLQWSVPYFTLPWESETIHTYLMGSNSCGFHDYNSKVQDIPTAMNKPEADNFLVADSVYGAGVPLTSMEYISLFESHNMKPEADYIIDRKHSVGWKYFWRCMFWLAVVNGCLVVLHGLLVLVLKFKRKIPERKKGYGALTFPRFEIFLIILSLPGACMASTAVVQGGTRSGLITGILLLGFVSLLLLALFLFLSIGITLGKLLQYKEVHKEEQTFHWYLDIIRVTVGPGKRGQWTWKNQPNSIYLIMLGPLFEDLRGPPKYMLSQISGGDSSKQGDRIIDTDDETEDAEAPFIQKLFGILRIYYTLFELVKQVVMGCMAGAYRNKSSTVPSLILLPITSFQLIFLLFKKPFIKKKVQLVQLISTSCQVGLFAACFFLSKRQLRAKDESRVGMLMIMLFLLGFCCQMVNEWYALYRQIKWLDPSHKSFWTGLKLCCIGLVLFFFPQKLIEKLQLKIPMTSAEREGSTPSSYADRFRSPGGRSSGSTDKPWLKQLREMAKASFSRDANDPSSSRARWSGFWSNKRSGSSSDIKTTRGLDQDLEAIFASK